MSATIPTPRYRIVERLGRGGMGEVCLADDLQLDRQVALKFPANHLRPDAMNQLLTEARSAAALDHPFICRIHEVTELDGRPCIVMERVRGETLEQRLRHGRVQVAEALRIAEEVAEALEAAHKRRVIHRDLKPANVMITEDQHIKVMDFGLARRLPDTAAGETNATVDRTETVAGTPAYMAPEQIYGHPVDRGYDIFSFGVLVYELLSGSHPFRRPSLEATLAAIVTEAPVDLRERDPRIPTSVAAAVSRMLAKDPRRRIASFAEIRQELHGLVGVHGAPDTHTGTPIAVPPPIDLTDRLPGRAAELHDLLQEVRQSEAGHGGLVLLGGDPGIGKSRLAEEALAAARQLGYHTLVGRCSAQEGTPALMPYVEILEAAARVIPASLFREAVGRSAPELARLLPELHRLFPDMQPPLELPAQLRQRFLFTNIHEFLARCSRLTPLIVFLDDFQWADESTLQLTEHLAPHLETLPVLVIAASRDPQGTPARPQATGLKRFFQLMRGQPEASVSSEASARALDQLVAQRHARRLRLRPLTEEAVIAMLSRLGPGTPPRKVARQFFEETDGNPFFVEELFRHLHDERRLLDPERRWNREIASGMIDLPPSIRAVIDRRLRHISEGALGVLTAAAVVGRSFDLELLEHVADVDGDRLVAAVEEGERAELVKGPSGRQERHWRFTHHLIWQTLVSSISQARRQRLHVKAADAIGRLDPTSATHASDLAHHLYSAGPLADFSTTARALVSAGDAATAVYATDDAIRNYGRAVETLQERGGDERTQLEVRERLADLLALTGDRAGALDHLRVLAGLHARGGSRLAEARALRKIGTTCWHGGDRAQAMASYQHALRLVEESPPGIEAAHLYQELGLAAFRSGDNERAIEWAERALTAAEAASAQLEASAAADRRAAIAAIAHATNTIGVALARLGQLDAARQRIEHSVTAARQQELLDVACRGYANLGVVYGSVEPQRAIDVSLTGLELASRIGAVSLQSYLYANLAAAYCALTNQCESEGLVAARTAVRLDRELGQLDHLAVPLIVLGQIHQCHGRLDQARESYDEALSIAERVGEPQLLLPCYDGLATICLDRGDRQLAEEYMVKAQELCERTGLDPDAVLLLPFLC